MKVQSAYLFSSRRRGPRWGQLDADQSRVRGSEGMLTLGDWPVLVDGLLDGLENKGRVVGHGGGVQEI